MQDESNMKMCESVLKSMVLKQTWSSSIFEYRTVTTVSANVLDGGEGTAVEGIMPFMLFAVTVTFMRKTIAEIAMHNDLA